MMIFHFLRFVGRHFDLHPVEKDYVRRNHQAIYRLVLDETRRATVRSPPKFLEGLRPICTFLGADLFNDEL